MRATVALAALAAILCACDAVKVEPDADAQAQTGDTLTWIAFAPPGRTPELAATIGTADGDAAAKAVAGVQRLEADRCLVANASRCGRLGFEADAALAAGGRFGAVASVSGADHPIVLAQLVAGTTFGTLTGAGVYDLVGLAPAESAPDAEQRLAGAATPISSVGVVARLGESDFAAAVSSAGILRVPRGQLGAVAVEGAAVHAGDYGAVAATGDSRTLIRSQLAKRVYDQLAAGRAADEAVKEALADVPSGVVVGVAAISRSGAHAAANSPWELAQSD